MVNMVLYSQSSSITCFHAQDLLYNTLAYYFETTLVCNYGLIQPGELKVNSKLSFLIINFLYIGICTQ